MSEEEEERVAFDRFLPSFLRYDDLSTYVVEDIAEVASVVEAGEVEGETTWNSRGGTCRHRQVTCQEDHPAWCSPGCLSVASRSCQ